ncbi:MAG: hypothetical protein IIW40_00685 [Clostridia bacterium]|nr:hypothetical protein [Clostridia bacterium]
MNPENLENPEMTVCELPEEQPAEVAEECPMPPEEVDVTDRLAEDFIRLSEEFPELNSPAQLPDEVLQTAAEENISLLDAWLRYRWQEEKQVREAARLRALAAQQSAGSLAKGADKRDPAPDSFLRAFRAALR